MSLQSPSFDGRSLIRGEANLLLIELKRLPANRGSASASAAALIKQAVTEQTDLPLRPDQVTALKRALEGIRLKRHRLPAGLAQLRTHLHG